MSLEQPSQIAAAPIAPSSRSERRAIRRTRIACRARIRPIHDGQAFLEEVCDTLNVSRGGVYFSCAHASYREHMHLYVSCPDSNSALDRAGEMARVVRVDALPGGKWGVAVNYLRFSSVSFHSSAQHETVSRAKGWSR